MSRMSDLDLMVREGERTPDDFIDRGFTRNEAEALAEAAGWQKCAPSCSGSDVFETEHGVEHQACDFCAYLNAPTLRPPDLDGFYTAYETAR